MIVLASGVHLPLNELSHYLGKEIRFLRAVVTKGTTWHEREGNKPPRMASRGPWMMNSIGLQNPGLEKQIKLSLEFSRHHDVPVWLNLYAPDISASLSLLKQYAQLFEVIEVNASCPNVLSPELSMEDLKQLRATVNSKIFLKLPPNAFDVHRSAQEQLRPLEECVHGLVIANTLAFSTIPFFGPEMSQLTAGVSGPFLLEKNCRTLRWLKENTKLELVGCGGVYHVAHVSEYRNAGANYVEVASGHLWDPHLSCRLARQWSEAHASH